MQSLNNSISLTKKQIIERYNKGCTIVLFTSKETLLFKLDCTNDSLLNEVLNSGLYRYNRVTHGRILQ